MLEVRPVKLSDITISDRARQEIGDLNSIKFSIDKVGVLMPILLNDKLELLDGERRIRACQELEHETIPARIISGISPEDKLLIERIANTDRKDFIWAEELELKLRIHEYHVEQNPKWSYRDTCEFLGVSLGGLSTDLQMALAIRTIPELAKAKTKRQAYDTYKKLGQRVQAVQAMESLPEDERNRLQQMLDGKVPKSKDEAASSDMPEVLAFDEDTDEADINEHDLYGASGDKVQFVYQICKWEKLLASIPDKVIGLVELDPPYAIDYNSLYASDTNQNDEDWTLEEFQDNMSRLLDQLYPKLLDASWILCWTGYEHVEWLNGVAQDIGYGIQRPGFWFKPGGTANSLKSNLISNYETYLLFRKGQATFNTKSLKAGFECESVAASRKYHQWQKPLEVYQRFLDALGRSGSIFLSPFAGSGSSMICAALNDMIPVGCDKSSKYFFQFYKTLKEHLNVEQADLSALTSMDSD